jgi:AcrR family transcriptional regulator
MRGKGREALQLVSLELCRDIYGFAVRPQHLQRYREYATIYKEEEEERSERWQHFLETYVSSAQLSTSDLPSSEQLHSSVQSLHDVDPSAATKMEDFTGSMERSSPEKLPKIDDVKQDKENHKTKTWSQIRPSLDAIEQNLSFRIRKRRIASVINKDANSGSRSPSVEELRLLKVASPVSEEDSEEEFYDVERSDLIQDASSNDSTVSDSAANSASPHGSYAGACAWKEELESLVRGGVPMALRKELWQAFVGTGTRRIENYYNELLMLGGDEGSDRTKAGGLLSSTTNNAIVETGVAEKWKSQIEKDLPRTFPGHPALDEDGRNALRRLLTAYARHNPSVGYCQAMNFFAGLLLLMMPEENAFWTLTGIIDEYFDGYYSEKMVEAQVDQLVFEDLVREFFPRLVTHFDKLGVQVAWVTGPWFLSIFVNILPWESVLRVWDVLLYQGNRTMLFRTALALMELYGPALVTTKDAGDAVTLLQSLAGSTFDSSQLVLTACMGYQAVDETRLQELQEKHRPTVLVALEERYKEPRLWRSSKGLARKLYNGDHEEDASITEGKLLEGTVNRGNVDSDGNLSSTRSGSFDEKDLDNLSNGFVDNDNAVSVVNLQEQVKWLKNELCRALEEKRSATLRAEELETALVEMVKEDNRRLLSAKLEQVESEMENLRQVVVEKEEQERAMLQVMMRIEHEQRLTEDARLFAEQDAAAQRHAANMLQEKYEEAMNQLSALEKRAIMAESMLEATLQCHASQHSSSKKIPDSPSTHEDSSSMPQNSLQRVAGVDASPRHSSREIPQELSPKKPGLLSRPFGLAWRDRNKTKSGNLDPPASPYGVASSLDSPSNVHSNFQLVRDDSNEFSDAGGSGNKD